jgi:hypothetical protein
MTIELWGALAFGVVIGWVTYRTLRRTKTSGLGDIATILGAVGGAAVTALFPAKGQSFAAYGIGLAIGFFLYLLTAVIVARQTSSLNAVNEWLGEPRSDRGTPQPGGTGAGVSRTSGHPSMPD